MRKFIIQVSLLLILIFGATYVSFQKGGSFNINTLFNQPNQTTKLNIDNTSIKVELADTPDKRTNGLGSRDHLASDSGMLFIFPTLGKYQFWMKDMLFPLDLIWIRDNMIVDLLPNVPPPAPGQSPESLNRYEPTTLVNKVLEVNAGFISSHNIKVGDKVELVPPK